jgi:hypothetical protein
MIWRGDHVTDVLDGGMDGVAAVEEEADEPGADEAAAASHAYEPAKGTAAVSLYRRRRRAISPVLGTIRLSTALDTNKRPTRYSLNAC